MKNTFNIKIFAIAVMLSLTAASCGDDPVSVNEDPPELPEFENVAADLSYFENNTPQNNDSNYAEAYYLGLGIGSLSMITQSYTGFFGMADSETASFEDGKWIWNYDYSYEDITVSITLIAEESANTINWEMLWSADDGQGNAFDNYRVVEGSIAKDGKSGSWTFNDLNTDTNEEEPVFVTEWSSMGENTFQSQTTYLEDNGTETVWSYEQDGNHYTVQFSDPDETNDITVFWDTETGTGYYQTGTDPKLCWDSSYQDVSCSSVGY